MRDMMSEADVSREDLEDGELDEEPEPLPEKQEKLEPGQHNRDSSQGSAEKDRKHKKKRKKHTKEKDTEVRRARKRQRHHEDDREDENTPPPSPKFEEDGYKRGRWANDEADDFLDSSVAATEREGIYGNRSGKRQYHPKSLRKIEKSRQFHERRIRYRKDDILCKLFKEGRCQRGDDCLFAHDLSIQPRKKPDICKYYIQSYCNKGDDCIFMHGEYPCKFFHTGQTCYQGDKCKFSHTDLDDEGKILLEKVLNHHRTKGHHFHSHPDASKRTMKRNPLLNSPTKEDPPDLQRIPSLFAIQTYPPEDDDECVKEDEHGPQLDGGLFKEIAEVGSLKDPEVKDDENSASYTEEELLELVPMSMRSLVANLPASAKDLFFKIQQQQKKLMKQSEEGSSDDLEVRKLDSAAEEKHITDILSILAAMGQIPGFSINEIGRNHEHSPPDKVEVKRQSRFSNAEPEYEPDDGLKREIDSFGNHNANFLQNDSNENIPNIGDLLNVGQVSGNSNNQHVGVHPTLGRKEGLLPDPQYGNQRLLRIMGPHSLRGHLQMGARPIRMDSINRPVGRPMGPLVRGTMGVRGQGSLNPMGIINHGLHQGPPNMNQGLPPNMSQGLPPNISQGPPPNIGQAPPPNIGQGLPPNIGQGLPNIGPVPPNMGPGPPPNMGPGPPNMGPGPPNMGPGPPNMGPGPPNMGPGPPNMGPGPPNMGPGPPNMNLSGINLVPRSIGIGLPNIVHGISLSHGPPNMSQAPPNMSQPPPNMTQPPPNMTQPPPNMSQPPPSMSQPPPSMSQPPPNMSQPPPSMNPVSTNLTQNMSLPVTISHGSAGTNHIHQDPRHVNTGSPISESNPTDPRNTIRSHNEPPTDSPPYGESKMSAMSDPRKLRSNDDDESPSEVCELRRGPYRIHTCFVPEKAYHFLARCKFIDSLDFDEDPRVRKWRVQHNEGSPENWHQNSKPVESPKPEVIPDVPLALQIRPPDLLKSFSKLPHLSSPPASEPPPIASPVTPEHLFSVAPSLSLPSSTNNLHPLTANSLSSLSHRNDPRFRKKKLDKSPDHKSSTMACETVSNENVMKVRKLQLNYTSPLDIGTKPVPSYNVYDQESSHGSKTPTPEASPESEEKSDSEKPSLKQVFTSIDPTASPFC